MTKITLGVAGVVAVAATAIALRQQQAVAQLRAEMAALHDQSATATALRAENQRLTTARTEEQAAAAAEHNELVRLRAEKAAFLKAAAAKRAAAHASAEQNAGRAPDGSNLAPGMVSVELMNNVGNTTPSATAQTIAWGLQHADYKAVANLLQFDPADRQKLEAFIATLPENLRAQYGTPEQVVALVMAGSPRPIAGVQLLSRTQPDADTEFHRVQWQYQNGEVRQDEIRFQHSADGWKQIVSSPTVDRVIGFLKSKQ